MFPNIEEQIQLPFNFLTNEHLVVDLIYNPKKTKFLSNCEFYGAKILNGESMLKQQALKSWDIWNNL
jgi:shikimate dehydrogenase